MDKDQSKELRATIRKRSEIVNDEFMTKRVSDLRLFDRRDTSSRWIIGKKNLKIYLRDYEEPLLGEILEWGMYEVIVKVKSELLLIPKHSIGYVILAKASEKDAAQQGSA